MGRDVVLYLYCRHFVTRCYLPFASGNLHEGGSAIGRSLPISQFERQWLSFVGVRFRRKGKWLGGVGVIGRSLPISRFERQWLSFVGVRFYGDHSVHDSNCQLPKVYVS